MVLKSTQNPFLQHSHAPFRLQMAETISHSATKRYAVVTGANKGIGLEICRQLASHGVMVVLTARDEKRGIEALEKLKGSSGLSDDHLIFHKLDVVDPTSVSSLADFINAQFGILDILVNNAGVSGVIDGDDLRATKNAGAVVARECLQTNYYGAKRMAEAFIPLLQLSGSPRIVNVSSSMGQLMNISNKWAKGVLSDSQSLTEESVDAVLNQFLKDFKEGSIVSKGWPSYWPAYTISKAALNAYTRVLAKKYPNFAMNCVCPGYVKTDMSRNAGILSAEQGAESPVRLALLPDGGPSGVFYNRSNLSSF